MQEDLMFCSICGAAANEGVSCCDDASAISAPRWGELDYRQQALIVALVKLGGEANERLLSREVWLTGADRREAVRDLDPARGDTNLILRAPHTDSFGPTRLYRVTEAGLAAFASEHTRPADLKRAARVAKSLGGAWGSVQTEVTPPIPVPDSPSRADDTRDHLRDLLWDGEEDELSGGYADEDETALRCE
jgi:hypothetical protein